MTTIVLVRHAATTWSGVRYCGRADPALSAAGRRGAEALAQELAPTLPGDVRIVSSPSRRATQTAAAIAKRLTPPPRIELDEGWLETDVGLAEGLTFDEVGERFPQFADALASGIASIDWPGGETAADLERRITGAWAAVLATGRPTVVVSHAGSVRVAIALATGRRPDDVQFPDVAAWSRHEIAAADARMTS
jgi:broad specificity phosphatase PhoE